MENIDSISEAQTQYQEIRQITENMANKIMSGQIYNKLSKSIKQALLQDLQEIEEKFQFEQRIALESNNRNQSLDQLSEQVTSLASTMQERLSSLTEEINYMKENLHSNNTTSPSSTPSYAEAAKRKTVIFGNNEYSPRKLLKKLQTEPALSSLSITNIKTRQNFIELTAKDKLQKEYLKNTVKATFPELRIEDKKTPSCKLIFHNATIFSEEKITQALQNLNFEKEEINIIRTVKSKKEGIEHVLIELPKSKTQATLLKNYSPTRPSFIYIGLQRLYYKIFVRLNRCRNCQSLVHPTYQCTSETFCAICGERHHEDNCKAEKPFCINCHDHNSSPTLNKATGTYNPLHPASSNECPTYRAKLKGLIHDPTLMLLQEQQKIDKASNTLSSN